MFRKYAKGGIRRPEDLFQPMSAPEFRGLSRPCLVDGKPATFHRWVEEERGILRVNAFMREEAVERVLQDFQEKNIIPPTASLEKIHEVKALVEWPDGSVSTVDLELITFLDRREG